MAMHLLTMTLYQGKNQINCPLQWQCTFKTMTLYQGKIRNNYSAYDPNILYTRLPPQIPCYASSLEIESQIGFKLKYICLRQMNSLSLQKYKSILQPLLIKCSRQVNSYLTDHT